MCDLTDPIFTDENEARNHFEAIRWPEGPICPHCGTVNQATRMQGKSHRTGAYQCNSCRGAFTVTVGSVMESSHVPLNKWALGFHLMAASKKGISAHQLHRMLGVTYKTAWFMAHRIREAMAEIDPPPLGGKDIVVEADETFHGPAKEHVFRNGKGWVQKSGAYNTRDKIVSLVERGGRARSFRLDELNMREVKKVLDANVDPATTLNTDEARMYKTIGKTYAKHESVNHSKKEYGRGSVTTNTVEGFFSIFKRGMVGTYQHCHERHLHRYLAEFDFRYSNRTALGVSDRLRAVRAIKGAEGKRLTYNQSSATRAA